MMAEYIHRIYFDLLSGEVLLSYQGRFLPSTVEQDYLRYKALSERNFNTFDVLELSYGEYERDFAECSGYRVNPESKELEFSYPDPNNPEDEQPHQAPLSVEVAELKRENVLLKAQNSALTDRTDFHEDLIAEMATLVYA